MSKRQNEIKMELTGNERCYTGERTCEETQNQAWLVDKTDEGEEFYA
jgi:hypothetical protein